VCRGAGLDPRKYPVPAASVVPRRMCGVFVHLNSWPTTDVSAAGYYLGSWPAAVGTVIMVCGEGGGVKHS
jgi:hypothetical protein